MTIEYQQAERTAFESWYGQSRPHFLGIEQFSWDDSYAAWRAAIEWQAKGWADVMPSNALRADHGLAGGQCLHGVSMTSHCDSCAGAKAKE